MGIIRDIKDFIEYRKNKQIQRVEKEFRVSVANDLGRIRTGTPTEEDPKLPETKWEDIDIRVIDIAPNVYLVNKASRLCIGKGELDTYENRIKHIQKLMKRGHESVLEHSNVIALVRIPKNTLCILGIVDVINLLELFSSFKYLNTSITADIECINILIGGSIRAFIHVLRETDVDCRMCFIIRKIIEQSMEKEFLTSLIDNKLIDPNECTYLPDSKLKMEEYAKDDGTKDYELVAKLEQDPKPYSGKNVDLLYIQDSMKVFREVSKYGFHMLDIWKMCTMTVLFHDVSRAIGNQITRHRNGITQESQRYCEHNTDKIKDFVDPILLHKANTDRYNDLDDRVETEYLKRRNPFTVYKYLISQGVFKEDARAWLPMNVTTKIMMTFTMKSFAQFYNLRSEKGAQLEIRLVSEQLKDLVIEATKDPIIKEKFFDMFINDNVKYRAKFNLSDYDIMVQNNGEGSYDQFFKAHNIEVKSSIIEVDEDDDKIETEIIEKETDTKLEDMSSVDINSIEDAEKYLKKSEEMKNL